MASPVDQAWRFAQRTEKELLAKLAEKDPDFADIDQLTPQYRTACQSVIFLDFEFATNKQIEGRLWDVHGKINNRFRKFLSRFRTDEGKKKPVEKRKTAKRYLDFIKESQRFYRGYIQQLATRFGGIPELVHVARKFNLEGHAGDGSHATDRVRHLVLLSCHQTLVRLGDLSRYRETELVSKDRNWGPAIGYYDLAGAIYPASGAPHNQLAVIALTDGNHLRVVYHLYRALTVEEPFPTAKANLEIEFKKILTAWSKGELVVNTPAHNANSARQTLLTWFVRLHAKCYNGVDFSEHDELENEVLSQLAVDLKERSLEGALQRFSLINIAAEYFAGVRIRDDTKSNESLQALLFFLRLNVKTFFTLLRVLEPELERFISNDNDDNRGHISGSDRVTAVTRRILPGLRHYSSWLRINAPILVAQSPDSPLGIQIKEMWKIYATSLTLLAGTFPVSELPNVEYLLEEDEDTVGFTPFFSERVRKRYYNAQNKKPTMHDTGVERYHPNLEMLARVRDLLIDGLELQLEDSIPLALVEGGRFIYQEEGIPSEALASPREKQATPPVIPLDFPEIEQPDGHKLTTDEEESAGLAANEEVDPSESAASISMSTDMNRMVDSLVGPDPTDSPTNVSSHNPSSQNLYSKSHDAFHQTAGPPTPPAHAFPEYHQHPDESTTPFGKAGPLTARELVQMVQAYSPQSSQPPHPPPGLGTPRASVSSYWPTTPLTAHPSTAPSPQRQFPVQGAGYQFPPWQSQPLPRPSSNGIMSSPTSIWQMDRSQTPAPRPGSSVAHPNGVATGLGVGRDGVGIGNGAFSGMSALDNFGGRASNALTSPLSFGSGQWTVPGPFEHGIPTPNMGFTPPHGPRSGHGAG